MNKKSILKGVVPLAIVALGFGLFRFMVSTRPEPERRETGAEALLVEVQAVHTTRAEVAIDAQGQLIAAQRVIVAPEVSGRVRSMSEHLVPGGRFSQGEVMLRLDGRDYQLAVERNTAEVNRAQLELQLEEGRQRVAQREWEAFGTGAEGSGEGATEQGRALALRQPQVETAQVGVRAARSAIQQARLNLQRATLRAPFNAMVVTENVDVGQIVGPTAQVATLVGTDEFWAQVSVPVANLARIRFPDRDGEGSPAVVWQEVGGQRVERAGRVIRLLPDVDPVGAMARVLVAIDDPLALDEEHAGALPMLLGSFVHVEIAAGVIEEVVEVPRLAVRDGNRAYVMNDAGTLEIRELDVAWSREESLLVRGGLRDGEQVITSRVPSAVAGLALRTADTPTDEARAQAPSEPGSDT